MSTADIAASASNAPASGLTAADLVARYDDALDARRAAELSGDATAIREATDAAFVAWALAYRAHGRIA